MKTHRPILSLVLALLVLFSASSFTVGIHLCRGKVQNIALLAKAEGCEKEKKLPPCHRHLAAPCCDDELVTYEGQDFKDTASQVTIDTAPMLDVIHTPVLIAEVTPPAPASPPYVPPLRTEDLTVTHRTFLI